MDKSEYLRALDRDIEGFLAVAKRGLDPTVLSCPDWTLGQLVVHLANVYDFWSRVVEGPIPDATGVEALTQSLKPDRERRESESFFGSQEALSFFEDRAVHLRRVLTAADPDQHTWTWWPPGQTAGFVQRRMAHETAIHRWDAESAHRVQKPIAPAALASDGIDEAIRNELTGWPDEGKTFPAASFHLHCSDTPGEWTITFKQAGPEVTASHSKADVALTGSASELDLYIWGRVPVDALSVHGDAQLAARFRGLFAMN